MGVSVLRCKDTSDDQEWMKKPELPAVYMSALQISVGLYLHMEDNLEPIKIMKTTSQTRYLCTVDKVIDLMVEVTSKEI